jgi:hypothetical protein
MLVHSHHKSIIVQIDACEPNEKYIVFHSLNKNSGADIQSTQYMRMEGFCVETFLKRTFDADEIVDVSLLLFVKSNL